MEEVVGRNPRFMQDPQSDLGAVEEMGAGDTGGARHGCGSHQPAQGRLQILEPGD